MLSTPEVKPPAFTDDDQETELNSNFSIPVAVQTGKLKWQDSPAPGVMRKRLELIGTKNPRLTTLVKFAAGSSFEEHGHDGGEEFLVLDGVFSDASGNYEAGSYVRNPTGTFHAPFTEEGCTILVKLRQFQHLDRKQVSLATYNHSVHWKRFGQPGVAHMELHQFSDEQVSMYRISPECWLATQLYINGVEIFVCEGSISDDHQTYQKGTWLRYPRGSKLKISSPEGARIYLKQPSLHQ